MVNNKVKFAAFGKTRNTSAIRKQSKQLGKKCSECGGLEGRPGSARQLEAQQRSQAPMSSNKLITEGRPGASDQVDRMGGDPGAASRLVGQGQQEANCARLEMNTGAASGLDGQGQQKADFDGLEGDAVAASGLVRKDQQEDGVAISQGLEAGCSECKSDKDLDEDVLRRQSQRMEDEINNIKKTGCGRLARIFKLKKKIVGDRKIGQEPSAIKDPDTGELLVSSKDIKTTTLKYCVDNLKDNKVSKNVEVIVKLKEGLHKMRMEEDTKHEFEVDKEEIEAVVEKFKSKDTNSYDFLLKAGEGYQEAMGKCIMRMIKEETFPEDFRKTDLQMIWKCKNSAEELKNSRFIHLKSFLPRACEAVLVGKMKERILESSSMYQVGGQPGHSIDESIFVIKSLMALVEKSGKSIIFSLVDIVGFFDKEQILDVMDCLDRANISRKAAKLWFKLNEKTEIQVNTAAGMTESAEAGDLVGQGTAGAGLVSQLNLDMGLQQYFGGSQDELYYGGVRIEYTAYQDDIGKPSIGVREAQTHMTKLAFMLEDKGLEAHPDKTAFIMLKGSKKDVEKKEKELQMTPLKFGQFMMSRKEKDKYLGQILHEDGLAASVAATVADRVGKLKGAIFEVRSVVEEFTMQSMAGMMAAKTLLERALLPSLLSGACNWTGVSRRTEDDCDDIIMMFWKVMMKVPDGTPRISLVAETSTRRSKWRIWKEKVMLIKRIQAQESSTLSRQVYEKQLQLNLPGLAVEVTAICEQIGIKDVNYYEVRNEKIEEAIIFHHYKDLKEELYKSKKLDKIKHEDFRKEQDYLNSKSIESCRAQFRVRTEMVDTFRDNFRSKYRTLPRGQEDRDPGLLCGDCGQDRDSQTHCLDCPAWADARDHLDLHCIEDMVTYFRRVLKGREDKEKERRKRRTD